MALWLPVIGLQANILSMLVCVWPLALLVRPSRPLVSRIASPSLSLFQIAIWCDLSSLVLSVFPTPDD